MLGVLTALGSLAGGVGSLLNSGGSSGSQTTTVTPASMDQIGSGASDIWDLAIDSVLGTSTASSTAELRSDLTPEERTQAERIKQNLQQLEGISASQWYDPANDIRTLRQQLAPYTVQGTTTNQGLQGMIAEDTKFKEAAAEEYLNTMAGHDTNIIDALTGYQNKLQTPAFYLNLGGKNVGVNTGGTRDAISQLTDLATMKYGVGSDAAQRALTEAVTFTPNAAGMQFFNTIWPMAMQLQNLRFGLPSETTSASTSGSSFLERLGDFSTIAEEAIPQIIDAFKSDSEG